MGSENWSSSGALGVGLSPWPVQVAQGQLWRRNEEGKFVSAPSFQVILMSEGSTSRILRGVGLKAQQSVVKVPQPKGEQWFALVGCVSRRCK